MTVLREEGLEHFLKKQVREMNGLLIHGNDSASISSFGRQLVRAISGPSGEAERFNLKTLKDGVIQLEDEFFSLSLLGDRRVLWIDDADDSLLKFLPKIIETNKPANFVFVAAEALSKSSKLRQAVEASPGLASLALYEEGLDSIRERLGVLASKSQLVWSEGALDLFIEIVGVERSIVSQEFEKLALYNYEQNSISIDDVLAVCGDTATHSADALIDAMLAGDMETVDRVATALDSETTGLRVILIAALSHLTRLQDFAAMMERGTSADMAVRNAKPPIFFKRQSTFVNQLKKFDSDQLMKIQQGIAAAIFQSRKYSDLGDQVTSRALLSVARLARNRSA